MMNIKSTAVAQAPKKRLSWNNPDVRAIVYQILAVALVGGAGWYLVHNTLHNLSVRNINTGFGFLTREAGFAIGEGMWSKFDVVANDIQVNFQFTAFNAATGK